MPDIAFDFKYLHYAILVAQYGSFRATAESLNSIPPAKAA